MAADPWPNPMLWFYRVLFVPCVLGVAMYLVSQSCVPLLRQARNHLTQLPCVQVAQKGIRLNGVLQISEASSFFYLPLLSKSWYHNSLFLWKHSCVCHHVWAIRSDFELGCTTQNHMVIPCSIKNKKDNKKPLAVVLPTFVSSETH